MADVRLEQIGEQIPVGLQQRVGGIENVQVNRSIVSIDGRLDGIADVVERSDALQIRRCASKDGR